MLPFGRCMLLGLLVTACAALVHAKNFRVNSGFDVADLTPGDGLCVAFLIIPPPLCCRFVPCGLAVQESNAGCPEPTFIPHPLPYLTICKV